MPEAGAGPTRRLAIAVLAAACIAALAISLYVAFGDTQQATVGPSTYSRSAIGHQALLEILKRRGIDAASSRGASLQKLRHGGLLVLAEPDFQEGGKQAMQRFLLAREVLLVVPKWGGTADGDWRGWLSAAAPLPLYLVQTALDDAVINAAVVRADHVPAFPTNRLGATPHLTDPAQLLRADWLEPVVGGPDGILIGHRIDEGHEIYVLADPDVIDNHGMASGNAALAVALIDRARHGGPVIFDETIHGFSTVPAGRLRLLLARPFLAATLDVLLACGLVLWTGARRFGATLPRPSALRPGKLALIDNITDLLLDTGQQGDLLRRYVSVTIDDVAARLHAPELADGEARAAWIARAETERGMTRDAATIAAAARNFSKSRRNDLAARFAVAEAAYLWKQEMLDGAAGTGRRGGGDPRGNPQGGGGAGRRDRPDADEPAGGRPRAA